MPTLKPYTANLVQPEIGGPRATPEAFGSEIGAGLQSVGHGANVLYANIEERESRDAVVGASQIRAKYAKLLDEAQNSGTDTSKLKQDMTDELSKIGENFRTQKGQRALDMHTANTNLMFDEQANRIEVTRASAEAQLQAKQQIDSDSATLRSNPSFLAMAEDNARALVSTFRLPPEKRALVENQMIEQLNMAAVASSVRIDPEGTMSKLEAGEWRLTPEQRQQGVNMARTEINGRRADEEYARRLMERDRIERGRAAQVTLGDRILQGTLGKNEIRDNPDLEWPQKAELIHFQRWLANEKSNKTHPSEMMELFLQVFAPEGDPRKTYNADPIFRMAEQNRISANEARQAMQWVADQRDENNNTFKQKLAGKMQTIRSAMTADPVWAAQGELSGAVQMEVMNRADIRAKELRRENKDPSVIFDPTHKEYMFAPGSLKSIANDVKAQQRAMITPKVTGEDDPVYKDLPAGASFIDPEGRPRTKGKPKPPPPTKATAIDIASGYIKSMPRSASVTIDAPQRSRARVLNGKVYPNREAAIEALKPLYGAD
jgi:hypothetical protein